MVSRFAVGLTVATMLAQPAHALTFNFTTISGDTLTSSQAAAFSTAAAAWSSYLTNPITVNLQVGFTSLGSNILGETAPTFVEASAVSVKFLLARDETDATDVSAVNSLSTSTQSNIAMTSAQARAIGFTTNVPTDGTIEFNSDFSFSTSRNANGTIASGTYDLVGIAEHEIGHLLGFDSSIDGGTTFDNPGATTVQTLLDQFRYSGANTRSVTAGAAAYFSIDNGVTDINAFATGGSDSDQASHWANGSQSNGANAVMDPEVAAGSTQNISPLDLVAFDTIGYTLVPEPQSIVLLGLSVLCLIATRRRS